MFNLSNSSEIKQNFTCYIKPKKSKNELYAFNNRNNFLNKIFPIKIYRRLSIYT